MQRSLQFFLIQEIGETPYWKASYTDVNSNGDGKQCYMPISLDSQNNLLLEQLILEIKMYQPDAPPDALSQAKSRKLLQINNQWNQQLKDGWDSGQGRLGLTAEDVALLSGAFTLAKEAAALGLPLPKLITLDDQTIPFATIQEMTTLLLRYGAARAELSETFAARRKAVESATTLEELNALP